MVMYGFDSWMLTAADEKWTMASEMTVYRRIMYVSWREQ